MKRNIFFIFVFIGVILLFGCTVNDNTGLIKIYNISDTPVTNIKVGGTIIALYAAPGATIDYYYFFDIQGELTATGAVSKHLSIEMDGTYTLKPGYWFDCTISLYNSEVQIFLEMASEHGLTSYKGGGYYNN